MDNYTISIFGNKIFFEIISKIKLFSEFKVKYYDNSVLFTNDVKKENQIVVFFINVSNKSFFDKIKANNLPLVLIIKSLVPKNSLLGDFKEQMNMPFTILDFKKKIVSLIAKNEFRKNSLIYLNNYIIDKNERKIKKNNIELQLSEKEINFLILFSQNRKPVSRNFVLKNVWNYSSKSETHTVETHIHRLRKKIFQKFRDNDFIKNNNKGYYI